MTGFQPWSGPVFQHPWWLASGHAQTLAAALWPASLPPETARQRSILLDDGDSIVVHDNCPAGWKPGDRAALLTHGLAGSHRSPILARTAHKLMAAGIRVFRWDMRGCGAGRFLAWRPYHAGCSEDLGIVIEAIGHWIGGHPRPGVSASSLILCGVSMGGNIVLKYLGESPLEVPSFVRGGLAVNPPLNLAESVSAVSTTGSGWYDRYFTSKLLKDLNSRREYFPEQAWPRPKREPKTLREFDEIYTAPLVGFRDPDDYYLSCSSGPHLGNIRVPTMVVTSSNDPLVPIAQFAKYSNLWNDRLQLQIVPGGGHLGYVAKPGLDPDVHWVEWRIVELLSNMRLESHVLADAA